MTRAVQGLWIGSDLSPMERMTIGSFLAHGHEFHLYTYGDVSNIPDGTKVMDATSILPRSSVFTYRTDRHAGSYAGFANLFRFKLLAERGGIWTDMDLVCLKPFCFKDLAVSSERMVDLARVVPTATVLAAPDGPSAFFAECYAVAAAMDPTRIRIRENSAFVLERLIKKHGLERHMLDPRETGPIEWWALGKLVVPPEPALPDCLGVHLWHEMWRVRGIDKRRIHPPNTLYGRFQREYP
jgi:hypothetical protein